jgi:hypothetical protein
MKTLDFSEYSGLKEEYFKKAINKLLSETFVVKEDDKNTYDFIRNNDIDVNDYFNVMGYAVEVREAEGYCCLIRDPSLESIARDPNSVTLSSDEKIVLAVFWKVYIERYIQNAIIKVAITRKELTDILTPYLPPKIVNSPTQLELLLKIFKKHNIIKVIGDIREDNTEIRIYPSVMMALNENEIQTYMNGILSTNDSEHEDVNDDTYEEMDGEIDEE